MFFATRFVLSNRFSRCYAIASTGSSAAVDVEKLFTSENVQELLIRLSGVDVTKVFKQKPLKMLKTSEYRLMTDEDLKYYNDAVHQRAKQTVSALPPFMLPRKPVDEVICVDPDLNEFDTARWVFTDTTFGVPNRERIIVVREPDGTLRRGTLDERDRMNRIYFQYHQEKSSRMPRVFVSEYLDAALKSEKHEFVMDFACHFFEPDDPEFIRVSKRVYEHIISSNAYHLLYSTRHFAGFVFYLTMKKNIDDLFAHFCNNNRFSEVLDLVKLYYTVNGGYDLDSVRTFQQEIVLLTNYARSSPKRTILEQMVLSLKHKQAQFIEASAQNV